MSFGGVVGAMITSLKNNKRERPSAYKKLKDHQTTYEHKTELHFDRKSSPEELRRLKERMRKENRKIFYRKVFIFCLMLIVVIAIIGWVKF